MAEELVRLEKERFDIRKKGAEEFKDKQKDLSEKLTKEGEMREEKAMATQKLGEELKLLQLQAGGQTKRAAAYERELRVAAEVRDIRAQTNLTEAEAVKMAREKVRLEDQLARRQGGSRKIQGYKQEGNRYTNRFRGLDAMEAEGKKGFFHQRMNTPGLDAHAALNDRRRNVGDPMEKKARNNARRAAAEAAGGQPKDRTDEMVRNLEEAVNQLRMLNTD
jgi:hypothetical protein